MKRILSAVAATAAMGATAAHASTLSVLGSLPGLMEIGARFHHHFHHFGDGDFKTVPEPASWMLMIVGFAVLAVALRMRQRTQAKSEA